MDLFQAIIMGIVQGISEFLPISSDGHLALMKQLLHIETDTGFYIIKMVDNNASDAYDTAVTEAISQAEQDAFDAEYENIKKEYTIVVNNKIWDPIVIGKTTIIETATSDNTGNSTTDTTTATGEDTQDTTTGE